MCIYCEMWGDGIEPWYLNPRNYARQLYTVKSKDAKPKAAMGEADPNAFIKQQKAAVDAMEVSAEEYLRVQAEKKKSPGFESGAHLGVVGGWIGQVIPLQDMEKIVDFAGPLGLIGCICRLMYAGIEERGEHGFTCMGNGVGMLKWERWPERYKHGVYFINREETKQWLRDLNKRGMFHSIMLFDERFIGGICNCDYPMCDSNQWRLDHGSNMLKGHYVAVVDEDICNGCSICAQRCQWGALKINVTNGKANIDQFRCFGCGLCETACPRGAISLADRTKIPSLQEVW